MQKVCQFGETYLQCVYANREHPDKTLRQNFKLADQKSRTKQWNGYKFSLTNSYSKMRDVLRTFDIHKNFVSIFFLGGRGSCFAPVTLRWQKIASQQTNSMLKGFLTGVRSKPSLKRWALRFHVCAKLQYVFFFDKHIKTKVLTLNGVWWLHSRISSYPPYDFR